MMEESLPKGFTCACGEEHRLPIYLYAHWREVFDFTCPQCGAAYSIVMGIATPKKKDQAR